MNHKPVVNAFPLTSIAEYFIHPNLFNTLNIFQALVSLHGATASIEVFKELPYSYSITVEQYLEA